MAADPPPEPAWARLLTTLYSAPVLRVYALVMVTSIAVISLNYLATREDPAVAVGDPGTGDFLAFYTGAYLMAGPHAEDLYRLDLQVAAQREILVDDAGFFQPYLNPPLMAWLLHWINGWGYVRSFYAFDLLMVSSLTLGLWGLVRSYRVSPADQATTVGLALAYAPMARMLAGGQNTPLTAALMAGLFVGLARGRWLLAGCCLGFLTYKPQFVGLVTVVLMILGQWRTVMLGGGLGLAHYGIGAVWVHPDWPRRMLEQAEVHRPDQLLHVGDQHFSLLTALPYWFGTLGVVVAPLLSAAVALTVLAVAWHHRANARQTANVWGITITGSMLCSPHLVYYDVGLLVVPVILLVFDVLAVRPLRTIEKLALTAAYFSYGTHDWAKDLGFQPLTILLIAVFATQLAWTLTLSPSAPTLVRAAPPAPEPAVS